jgi:hypothetical protein
MELELKRIALKPTHTIGRLSINGLYFCDTLEDPNRDYDKNGYFNHPECKVRDNTCIPFGRYRIELHHSPRFTPRYNSLMPLLMDVPHFSGILIHPGNSTCDTSGCILVGQNKQVGKVLNSKITWDRLMTEHLIPALMHREEEVFITIV